MWLWWYLGFIVIPRWPVEHAVVSPDRSARTVFGRPRGPGGHQGERESKTRASPYPLSYPEQGARRAPPMRTTGLHATLGHGIGWFVRMMGGHEATKALSPRENPDRDAPERSSGTSNPTDWVDDQ